MLKFISRHELETKATSAQAALALLQGAPAHFDVLRPKLIADAYYCKMEGITSTYEFQQRNIKKQLAKIS